MKKIPVEVKDSLTWSEITDVYRKQIENGSIKLDREKILNDLETVWRLLVQFYAIQKLQEKEQDKLVSITGSLAQFLNEID